MNALTVKERQAALLRRRVEFVIKYPALVRLIPKGQHARLATALCAHLQPAVLAGLKSQAAYDGWLTRVVEEPCWEGCTRGPAEESRWSLIAKLINITVYEIVVKRRRCYGRGYICRLTASLCAISRASMVTFQSARCSSA